MYGHILVIPELGKLQQENGKLEVSLSYMERKNKARGNKDPNEYGTGCFILVTINMVTYQCNDL